jgi:ASPIC and UnbV
VNGGVKRRPSILGSEVAAHWQPYAEPSLLFENRGDGTFTPLVATGGASGASQAGGTTGASSAPQSSGAMAAGAGAATTMAMNAAWGPVEVSRGLYPFDQDRDGDLDLLITTIDGPARLYRNDGGSDSDAGSWIEIRTLDPALRREALGAKVTAVASERRWVRHAIPPGGYLTSGHTWIHLGLGAIEAIDRFEVRWPDGATEVFPGAAARQTVELRRGEGEAR